MDDVVRDIEKLQRLRDLLDVEYLVNEQSRLVELWHKQPVKVPKGSDVYCLIMENHSRNFQLWHVEDDARLKDAPDTVIADCKRRIDRLNQERNDLVERIDIFLLQELSRYNLPDESAPLHSETIGVILDRLSIIALKLFHMNEQVQRNDVDLEHRQKCAEKYQTLRQQRADLQSCLQPYWRQVITGRRRFKVYRQYKMYNDPTMNMALVKERKSRDA